MDRIQSYTAASLQANPGTDPTRLAFINLHYWHHTDVEGALSLDLGCHSRNVHPLNACALYREELDAAPAAEVHFSNIVVAATGVLASFLNGKLAFLWQVDLGFCQIWAARLRLSSNSVTQVYKWGLCSIKL